MASVIDTALSGLVAASSRFAVSANNVANQRSTENADGSKQTFKPQEVVQQSLQGGGTLASVRPVTAPPISVFDPTSSAANNEGFVELPPVDLAQEATNRILAKNAFKSSLNIIKAQVELDDDLLSIGSKDRG